ncbi:MAG: hypothetical protein M1833_000628 [Piccolia ochrophora]|nr:MAG: hypothetical protein M1833_000628 [Piccolia ochrophora]
MDFLEFLHPHFSRHRTPYEKQPLEQRRRQRSETTSDARAYEQFQHDASRPVSAMSRLTDPTHWPLLIRTGSRRGNQSSAGEGRSHHRKTRSSASFREVAKDVKDSVRRIRLQPIHLGNEAPSGPGDVSTSILEQRRSGSHHTLPPYLSQSLEGGWAARAAAAEENGRLAARRLKKEPRVDCYAVRETGFDDDELLADKLGKNEDDPLPLFPPEISIRVLAELDERSLRSALGVSHKWHKIASTGSLWRSLFFSKLGGPGRLGYGSATSTDATAKGIGKNQPEQDWKSMYRARAVLQHRWRTGSWSESVLTHHTSPVYCVQFDDHKIIGGSGDSTFSVWDTHTGVCNLAVGRQRQRKMSLSTTLIHPSFANFNMPSGASLNDATFPAPSSSFPSSRADHEVGNRDATRNGPARLNPRIQHTASILCLQYDHEILVTGSSDTTCIVWSIAERYAPLRQLKHHSGSVFAVCLDLNHIVSCSRDKTICIWDRGVGEMIRELKGHQASVQAVQIRLGRLVSASNDGVIKLWDVGSGTWIRDFVVVAARRALGGIPCVFFTEDAEKIIAGYQGGNIYLWDANTGQCVREFDQARKHVNMVRSLHMDSASGRVVSGGYDNSVKIWDVHTGCMITQHRQASDEMDDVVVDVKIDYRRLVIALIDGQVITLDFGLGLPNIELLAV